MKLLVLGAGLQGSAAAHNLLQRRAVSQVTLADHHPDHLPGFLARDRQGLRLVQLDANDFAAVTGLMRGHTAVLCALPYYFTELMSRPGIAAGSHFCDLGGNTEIVFQQKKLQEAAVEHGISIIPDRGLAPGTVNILAAEGRRRLDQARSVRIYVGGLPRHPEPPLNYQIVYSLEGALDYYSTPSWVLRRGEGPPGGALFPPGGLGVSPPRRPPP